MFNSYVSLLEGIGEYSMLFGLNLHAEFDHTVLLKIPSQNICSRPSWGLPNRVKNDSEDMLSRVFIPHSLYAKNRAMVTTLVICPWGMVINRIYSMSYGI